MAKNTRDKVIAEEREKILKEYAAGKVKEIEWLKGKLNKMISLTKIIQSDKTATEFGGCRKCYGKGYATIHHAIGLGFKPCSCGRGQQIHEMVDFLISTKK